MPGTVVLNPAMVDGYGNPISVIRDEAVGVNRLLVSGETTKKQHIRLFDADGNSVYVAVDSGMMSLAVRDEDQLSVLNLMFRELKKIRKHLAILTEENIDDNDMEDED